MTEVIGTQPRLYAPLEIDPRTNEIDRARIVRLRNLQRRISDRPEIFHHAFTELGIEATADKLDLRDEAVEARSASRSPKILLKEYFTKHDDLALEPDVATENAIFDSEEYRELARKSREKRSVMYRKGVMGSYVQENPEAEAASNEVRRYFMGQYIGRVLLWKEQQTSNRERSAS